MTGITKIVVELGGKEHYLTLDLAQKLFNSLNDFFGPKRVYHYDDWTCRPRPYWERGVTYIKSSDIKPEGFLANTTNNANNKNIMRINLDGD